MRRSLAILALLFFLLPTSAQKKEIAAAKTNIKNGSNLENAEKSMRKLLEDSANRQNERIWTTLYAAIKKQYDQGNQKLYLKQQYDTANLFTLAKKMFECLEQFDSVEADNPRHRDRHAAMLQPYRPNLYNAGTFFIQKQKYQDALDQLNTYIDCARQPLFERYDYARTDTLLPQAAYWAAYCAYKLGNHPQLLHHAELASSDSLHHVYLLQYLAETYQATNDTAHYLQTLTEGFTRYPEFPFFFPRLVDYYSQQKQYDRAMNIVDQALQKHPDSPICRYAKSSIYLNTAQYDRAIALADSLITEHPDMPEPYLNAGLAYFNRALELDKHPQNTKRQRRQTQETYKQALPYLEQYRKLAPTDTDHWALPLYTIYLNLNMGTQFDEIDSIINSEKK